MLDGDGFIEWDVWNKVSDVTTANEENKNKQSITGGLAAEMLR
jgi:hypothetical protein